MLLSTSNRESVVSQLDEAVIDYYQSSRRTARQLSVPFRHGYGQYIQYLHYILCESISAWISRFTVWLHRSSCRIHSRLLYWYHIRFNEWNPIRLEHVHITNCSVCQCGPDKQNNFLPNWSSEIFLTHILTCLWRREKKKKTMRYIIFALRSSSSSSSSSSLWKEDRDSINSPVMMKNGIIELLPH